MKFHESHWKTIGNRRVPHGRGSCSLGGHASAGRMCRGNSWQQNIKTYGKTAIRHFRCCRMRRAARSLLDSRAGLQLLNRLVACIGQMLTCLCPPVRPSVRPSVHQSVSHSASRSVSQSVTQSAGRPICRSVGRPAGRQAAKPAKSAKPAKPAKPACQPSFPVNNPGPAVLNIGGRGRGVERIRNGPFLGNRRGKAIAFAWGGTPSWTFVPRTQGGAQQLLV